MNYQKKNHMLAVFKALANANRLDILKLIKSAKNEITVNEIVERLDLSQAAISGHLKLMRMSKIVKARQDGANMFYSVNDPLVDSLISMLE